MTLRSDEELEIERLRAAHFETRRTTVPALEEILYQPIRVLDHGFLRVIDYMGDDAAVVQAARVSYGKGTKKTQEDRGLIRYLIRHRHTTPFEMCEIKFHVKLPIFVARQWIRHRTANVNEYSARYSILDREFYVPAREHVAESKALRRAAEQLEMLPIELPEARPAEIAPQSKINKQGREGRLEEKEVEEAVFVIGSESARAYTNYIKLLNEDGGRVLDPGKQGIARELARMVLPTNFYTQWYWKIDLHNLMHFLELRADAHAQYEIRVYAEAMLDILKRWVPITYEAFMDYRKQGVSLSAGALQALRRRLRGESVTRENSGLSPREWRELATALGETLEAGAAPTRVLLALDLPAPADKVWEVIGPFDGLPRWHPLVEACTLEAEEKSGATLRRIRLKDGTVLVNRLLGESRQPRGYRYALAEGPVPVADYESELRVLEDGPDRCRVEWSARFLPKGVSRAEAARVIEGILRQGLDRLKAMFPG